MNPISLDELPSYSPWPRCLLNGGVLVKNRTREAVLKEYEEKYGHLIESLDLIPLPTSQGMEAIRSIEFEDRREIPMSIGKQLYAATLGEAMDCTINAILRYLRSEAMLSGSVVDLGCGYGYLLHRLSQCIRKDVHLRGGELTESGVILGNALGMDVIRFDFFDEFCVPLERAEVPSVVTTSFALHQLASAEVAVELLSRYREKISNVVCLEPEEDYFGGSLLGLLRQRYGRICGYSADLVRVLKKRRDITIDLIEENAVGANALLPGTITVWSFT